MTLKILYRSSHFIINGVLKIVIVEMKELLQNWPKEGRIDFKNVFLYYGTNKAPALNGLTMSIIPGEKVNIVTAINYALNLVQPFSLQHSKYFELTNR